MTAVDPLADIDFDRINDQFNNANITDENGNIVHLDLSEAQNQLYNLQDAFSNLELDANGEVLIDADAQAAIDACNATYNNLLAVDAQAAATYKEAVEQMANLQGVSLG